MASTTISLSSRAFGGIRRKNSSFDDSKITCSDCQNVELYYTDANAGIGLRRFKTGTPARINAKSVDFSIVPNGLNFVVPKGCEYKY